MHDTRMTHTDIVEPATFKPSVPHPTSDATKRREDTREDRARPEILGLCASCAHAEGCTFPRRQDRAVLCCEEFEGVQSAVAVAPASCQRVGGLAPSDPDVASRVKGLCKTCANRDGCTFPKPTGGVWHCEEFA